ncbi:MAG: alpha/beta hydrolase, partial [Pseudomonadota bacterium]|nr:alpha/beta hydrolase [Pseudomonadota bacterium]
LLSEKESKLLRVLHRYLVCWLVVLCGLGACSTNDFFRQKAKPIPLERAYGYGVLPDLSALGNKALRAKCEQQERTTALGVTLLLHCTYELLSRKNVSAENRQFALRHYNWAVGTLFQQRDTQSNLVQVNYSGPSKIFLVDAMIPTEDRLQPIVFGQLGSAAVSFQKNRSSENTNIDPNFPLEGIFSSYSIYASTVTLEGLRLHVTLHAVPVNKTTYVDFSQQQYALRYSEGAAFLGLLQSADIHNFSWLGFTNAEKAESRMGVFSIGPLSSSKTPLIMLHGLNSDPLIWRYLTMAILNDETLSQRFQIWHVYYPSGPPPFYNAMRVRKLLNQLKVRVSPEPSLESAVIVGHSMGGVIAKLLTSQPHDKLWDATFTSPPESLLSEDDTDVRDVFLFSPVFKHNTVFFLDTPHRGSDVANSLIGSIGSSLISLPFNFRELFRGFIEKVGVSKLTQAMLPFLQNFGPDSVQVLRPNHPLMTALATTPVEGKSYSIIGSTSALVCDTPKRCAAISDSVVTYSSAFIEDAEETIIVASSHNSFESTQAIQFILEKLHDIDK